MKYLSILLIAVALTACTFTPEQKQQWAATGSLVLQKAEQIAFNTILSAATSSGDEITKGDFLHSAAEGLRENMGSIVTSDDVAAIVRIWTPQKQHWETLAAQLAEAYAQAHPGDTRARAQVVEAIAEGLQRAVVVNAETP